MNYQESINLLISNLNDFITGFLGFFVKLIPLTVSVLGAIVIFGFAIRLISKIWHSGGGPDLWGKTGKYDPFNDIYR